MHKAIKDITGHIFGYLTVVSYAYSEKRSSFWNCVCVCGKEKVIRRNSLIKQHTVSCGCKQKELIAKGNSLPKGEAAFNEIYRGYKFRAKKANREFNISKEQFRQLTLQSCNYCNGTPNTKSKISEIRNNGSYIYNGLDRVDNNKGYTLENCVPCCNLCNKMKLNLTKEEFLLHIRKIYDRIS